MNTDIPRISLSRLTAPGEQARLADACEAWGFFRLVDHGISEDETSRFLDAAEAFFALEMNDKLALRRTEDNPWGFFESELTKNRQDWKEIYDMAVEDTPWPARLPTFRQAMLHWHQRCEQISLALLRAVCVTLGQSPEHLENCFSPVNTSFLRLNYYPLCTEPADPGEDFPDEGHLGIHHHTDAGALTVLLQDQVAGLQVRRQDQWHTIAPVPGSLIINVGDLVQVWSNDRYRAPLHRVLANNQAERFSAAYFFNPSFATNCEPLTPEPARYRPVNWGEFRSGRAAGDYADIGEEVQISDYSVLRSMSSGG